jgi:hypothetical protein
MDGGIDEAGHDNQACDWNVEGAASFLKILQAAGSADGNNSPILNQDRTVLNDSQII